MSVPNSQVSAAMVTNTMPKVIKHLREFAFAVEAPEDRHFGKPAENAGGGRVQAAAARKNGVPDTTSTAAR